MNEAITNKKEFKSYEYKTVTAPEDKASLYLDCYESFGWESDSNLSEPTGRPVGGRRAVLRLRRDRKIVNKMELTRLQRQFEACVSEILSLEKAGPSLAAVWAWTIALLGTAFMAGATFAATADPPAFLLSLLLGLPGIFGWILPFFVYRRVAARRAQKLMPLIEAKYDEIYEVCQKGRSLL